METNALKLLGVTLRSAMPLEDNKNSINWVSTEVFRKARRHGYGVCRYAQLRNHNLLYSIKDLFLFHRTNSREPSPLDRQVLELIQRIGVP